MTGRRRTVTPIVLDANLASQLSNVSQPVELRDPSGKVLGHFTPLPNSAEWEYLTPDISPEELRRRCQSNEPRYTTAEVLKRLEQL